MTKILKYALTTMAFFAMTVPFCHAQNDNASEKNKKKEQKKNAVINLNKLDVVYPEEDYTGVVIDMPETERENRNQLKELQYLLLQPPPMMDSVQQTPNLYQAVEDEGAESEDEILYASFDPTTIHYPRIDLAKWSEKDTVEVHLVNPRNKEGFVFPTPDQSLVTSHFGARRRRFHYGVDLAMPTGKPIVSAFDGVVRVSLFNRSYGNLIVVRHHNGLETYYAHMSQRIAQSGDTVHAGDTIGLCGNTGRSYGSHLHFEIRYMGAAMNPENVIDFSSRKLKNNMLQLTPRSFAKTGYASSGKNQSNAKGGVSYYRVRKGDTLGSIAKRNHTTVRRLCQLNGIKETTVLSIGRKLRIR
ncbi:MAG: M23 family metallopeptidase [Bacteroidales bacterium]|nr:M23 family metallopeptidase [Bacteroidales bacterium]